MSDALIASLNDQIKTLMGENASLKAESKDRRIKGRKATEELEKLRGDMATVIAERDDLKSKIEAKPGELQATIDQLQGAIRTRDHRDAFGSVKEFVHAGQDGTTKKLKLAEGVKIDALWQLSGYKAEGDAPDAKAISEHYGKAFDAHPFLFADAAPETGTTAPGGATRPFAVQGREAGPGAGKGTIHPPTLNAMTQIDASYGDRNPGRIA
jgi:hypothetical protein